jgi:hypothetical protein
VRWVDAATERAVTTLFWGKSLQSHLRGLESTVAVVVEARDRVIWDRSVYLLIGVRTRSAAGSFQQSVDTKGNDINHLMQALGALNKTYTLTYTLIVIGLPLITLGLSLYAQFSR